MADDIAAFDEPTARELIALLRESRSRPRFRPQPQNRGPVPTGSGEHVIVKVTSLTTTSGLYPATLQTWTYDAAAWANGASVWFLPANGETPELNRRYGARRMSVKTTDSKLIYSQDVADLSGSDPDASPTVRGYVNLLTQSFKGAKTFDTGFSVVYDVTGSPATVGIRTLVDAGGGSNASYLQVGSEVTDGASTYEAYSRLYGTGLRFGGIESGASTVETFGWIAASNGVPTGSGTGTEFGYGKTPSGTFVANGPLLGVSSQYDTTAPWVKARVGTDGPSVVRHWIEGPAGYAVGYAITIGGTQFTGGSGTKAGMVFKGGLYISGGITGASGTFP